MSKPAKEKPANIEVSVENPEAAGTAEAASAPSQTASGEAASRPSVTEQVEALRAQLAEKETEIAGLKDKYLRALAEQENARKRIRQQAEENQRAQREALLRALLPIVDDLERAVAAARGGGNGKPIVDGVEMVLRSIHEFFRGHGVIPRESVGQPFDPQRHEAVDRIESAEHPPNTVIAEFARGYQIADRTLRPARVAVAIEPKQAEQAEDRKDSEDPDGDVENS